jgi:hypothetical protein
MDFGSSCLTTRLRVLRFGRRAYRPATREIPMESMAGEVADVPAVASAVHERLPLVTPVPLIYPGHSPAYSDDSVHPVRRFRTRASEAAQRPTLGGLSR